MTKSGGRNYSVGSSSSGGTAQDLAEAQKVADQLCQQAVEDWLTSNATSSWVSDIMRDQLNFANCKKAIVKVDKLKAKATVNAQIAFIYANLYTNTPWAHPEMMVTAPGAYGIGKYIHSQEVDSTKRAYQACVVAGYYNPRTIRWAPWKHTTVCEDELGKLLVLRREFSPTASIAEMLNPTTPPKFVPIEEALKR